MITIDGSTLEGGGQLTRLALCLSAITRQSVRIHSIRAGRGPSTSDKSSRGSSSRTTGRDRDRNRLDRREIHKTAEKSGRGAAGLKDSHLAALDFLADHCNAKVTGAQVGSSEVVFRPSQVSRSLQISAGGSSGPTFDVSLTKPGSIWLIFQAVYPYLAFCTDWSSATSDREHDNTTDDKGKKCITLTLRGGTNVSKAMSTEYVAQVFAPVAAKIGLPGVEIETVARGWAGNAPAVGEVVVRISSPPASNTSRVSGRLVLPSFTIEDGGGGISKIAVSVVAHLTMTNSGLIDILVSFLSQAFPAVPVETVLSEDSGDARRFYVLLVAHLPGGWRMGRDYLGSGAAVKNAAMEHKMVDEACQRVVGDLAREVTRARETGGCVDEYLQDQLVVFQALSQGTSSVSGGGDIQMGRGVALLTDGVAGRDLGSGGLRADTDENGDEIDPARVERVGDESGTLHTRTVRWVCETMLEDYSVVFEKGGRCRGIGLNGDQRGGYTRSG